jgi:poly(3-hydroxybutyrate) depolymerase
MSMLSAGLQWLQSSVFTAAAVTISYRRSTTTLNLSAIPGRSDTQATTPEGLVITNRETEFLVKRANLAALWPPIAGDVITNGTKTYRTVRRQTGEVWRTCDQTTDTVRITVQET